MGGHALIEAAETCLLEGKLLTCRQKRDLVFMNWGPLMRIRLGKEAADKKWLSRCALSMTFFDLSHNL
jgi:hypothetical protein